MVRTKNILSVLLLSSAMVFSGYVAAGSSDKSSGSKSQSGGSKQFSSGFSSKPRQETSAKKVDYSQKSATPSRKVENSASYNPSIASRDAGRTQLFGAAPKQNSNKDLQVEKASRRTTFGGFGPAASVAAASDSRTAIKQSALSADMGKSAASATALATLDARRNPPQVSNTTIVGAQPPIGPQSRTAVVSENRVEQRSYNPPVAQTQVVNVHHESPSSSSNALLWYMIGRSSADRPRQEAHTVINNYPQQGQRTNDGYVSQSMPQVTSAQTSAVVSSPDPSVSEQPITPVGVAQSERLSTVPAQVHGPQDVPKQPDVEKTGWPIFRFIFWTAIFSGVGYGIYRLIKRAKLKESRLGSRNYKI